MKAIAILWVIVTLAVAFLCGCTESYDSQHAIYKFIPPADRSWTDRFGDTDNTRMKYTVSELRVVVAEQGKRLLALELVDPNEVKK